MKNKKYQKSQAKHLCMYGKLHSKPLAYCKLHKCGLLPFQIKEKACKLKKCRHFDDTHIFI